MKKKKINKIEDRPMAFNCLNESESTKESNDDSPIGFNSLKEDDKNNYNDYDGPIGFNFRED